MILTHRFQEALIYAVHLHGSQTRKGADTPYIAHLFSVTALVLEDGGDEDEAIAALLHDAVEDQGGLTTLTAIQERFGQYVSELVDALTDSYDQPKPEWRGRKERYLDHLRSAPPAVRRISLADKLHNARSLLADLQIGKSSMWERFNGGREGTLWYYRSLVDLFQEVHSGYLVDELGRVVTQIEQWETRY